MTALFATLLMLSGSSASISDQGAYRYAGGESAWEINAQHCLVWDGQPYLPVGVRIPGTVEDINAANSAGVKDVIVELPANGAGWSEAFGALERNGMRYVLAINSLAPMADGVSVEPGGYRIDGITANQHIDLAMPGCRSVFTVLATRRDGAVESEQQVDTINGHFVMDVKPLNDLEHVLLMYPQQRSLQQPDYWDQLDAHRDELISCLRRSPPGKGLRGLLDPMGASVNLRTDFAQFVPTSGYFQLELSGYLETKYKSLDTALRTWSLSSSDVDSFDRLARLVPLWYGTRGVSELYDPATRKTYLCDKRQSLAWRDIGDVIRSAADRRFRRLVEAIRAVVNIPVLQDWEGWAAPYENADPALDGVGARVDSDSPSMVADEAGHAASSVLRWRRPGWLPVTRIELGEGSGLQSLPGTLDDLASLGTRGWYVRTDDPAAFKVVAEENSKRSSNAALANEAPKTVYYPEAAANPAAAQRLPGGNWWIPSPYPGNRIDLGSKFHAYRIVDSSGSSIALWCDGDPQRVKLCAAQPKLLKFSSLDGVNPAPKYGRSRVEVRLSQTPVIVTGSDEIPIPEASLAETVAMFDQLSKVAGASMVDISEDSFVFKDNLSGFDRNPGGSFAMLRLTVEKLSQKLASYTWIEGESSPRTTFSESLPVSGCSAGGALTLETALADRTYYAEYDFRAKSDSEMEVWVAARLPKAAQSSFKVIVGGQAMTTTGPGLSPYGLGFAWYRFGLTKLPSGKGTIRLEAVSTDGVDLAVDAILLYPGTFRPNGVNLPELTLSPSKQQPIPGMDSPAP